MSGTCFPTKRVLKGHIKNNMNIRKTLNDLNIIPRKSRGQNFLVDDNIVRKIVDFANVGKEDYVLEIGPGVGAISGGLIERAGVYCCVEIEEKFIEFLRETYPAVPKENFINRDVRTMDLGMLPQEITIVGATVPGRPWSGGETRRITIVSNLPYSISSEVVFWIFKNRRFIKNVTLLLQREFAERLAAQPCTKAYGSITVQCNLYADAKLGDVVSGNCFFPKADVESRLIKLEILPQPRCEVKNEALFEAVLRGSFSMRRKTIANALGANLEGVNTARGRTLSTEAKLTKDKLLQIFASADIDYSRRGETLTVQEFCKLADLISALV